MLTEPLPDLEAWVLFFRHAHLPILRHTARQLEEARQNKDHISGSDLAKIVLRDPLLAVSVLAFIQPMHGKHLQSQITTIEHSIIMLGVDPFFREFESPITIEAALKNEPEALLHVLQTIQRVQRASRFARSWAFERHDLDIEEVTLAALLHDLAEILLWCFAPKLALAIHAQQRSNKTLRSAVAQESILGIRLFDLQRALCSAWQLPELLALLMDDTKAYLPRVQNVSLAVNLARHLVRGWDDAALPDDFAGIENLLRIDRAALLSRLEVPAEWIAQYLPPEK